MTEKEIIEQLISIGVSLQIKEIDYNKAIEITRETLIKKDSLISFKSLFEESKNLYDQAKKAPTEREELILASKSIMCREIANRLLNT